MSIRSNGPERSAAHSLANAAGHFLFLVLVLGVAGCRGVSPVTTESLRGGPSWELPDDLLGRQFLFRLKAEKAGDSARLRLALRVVGRRDFELEALDSLGRRQWGIRAKGDQVFWLDHREHTVCSISESIAIPEAFPIPVAPWALPRVLLGLAPQAPHSLVEAESGARIYADSLGQRWRVVIGEHGEVSSWTGQGLDGSVVSWERRAEELSLVAKDVELEVHWKMVANEALVSALLPPTVPTGYREVDCARNR